MKARVHLSRKWHIETAGSRIETGIHDLTCQNLNNWCEALTNFSTLQFIWWRWRSPHESLKYFELWENGWHRETLIETNMKWHIRDRKIDLQLTKENERRTELQIYLSETKYIQGKRKRPSLCYTVFGLKRF